MIQTDGALSARHRRRSQVGSPQAYRRIRWGRPNAASGAEGRGECLRFLNHTTDYPELLLFASDGVTLLAQDDDSRLALNSLLEQVLPAGQYFVGVRGVSHPLGFPFDDCALQTDCTLSIARVLGTLVADFEVPTCLTSLGEPLRLVPRCNEFAQLGGEFALDVDGVTSISPILLLSINAPPTTPIELAILGGPGCFLGVIPVVSGLGVTPAAPAKQNSESRFRATFATSGLRSNSWLWQSTWAPTPLIWSLRTEFRSSSVPTGKKPVRRRVVTVTPLPRSATP